MCACILRRAFDGGWFVASPDDFGAMMIKHHAAGYALQCVK